MKHTTGFTYFMSLCVVCHSLTRLVIFVESRDYTHFSLLHALSFNNTPRHFASFIFIFRVQTHLERNRQ